MVHAEHFRKALSCGSCGRLLAAHKMKPIQKFSDGRVSCLPCLQEAVSDITTLEAVARRVRLGISELGFPRPTGQLSMKLVNQNQLNREVERLHGRGSLRGLTLTTFRTITGGPNEGTTFSHEVWVLAGLPVVECLSVLAHEFTLGTTSLHGGPYSSQTGISKNQKPEKEDTRDPGVQHHQD